MSKPQVEHRTIPCEFRVAGDSGSPVIYGYAAKFGVRSEDMGGWVEIIAPNSFDAHLATNPDVRGLYNHNADLVLGRTAANTMRVSVDTVGLAYEIDAPDTQYARDLLVSMKRGDVNQSSFGFIAKDASWDYDEVIGVDVRTVKEAELFDCSPVTFPAYTQATSGVRSLPDDMPVEVRSKVTKRMDTTPLQANANGCECDCPECADGDCQDCTNADCADENCRCQSVRSLNAKVFEQRVKVNLALCD